MTIIQRFKRLTFWNKLGVVASILTVVTFVPWFISFLIPGHSTPNPHFKFYLRLGDSTTSTILLTNDYLFSKRMKQFADLPNGSIMLHSFVDGCLVIPVKQGKSNENFNFIVENDSPVKVNDLLVCVGFPKDLECSFGTKWNKIHDESLIIPGSWKITATNMQYVAAQSPWALFPYDSWNLPPITIPCAAEYAGTTLKGEFFELVIRCTGFERLLAANIIFVPVGTNSFKPFLTLGRLDSGGFLHVEPSPKEFEDSQK